MKAKLAGFFKKSSKEAKPIAKEDLYLIEKKQEHFPFDFDRWYRQLAHLSFYSEILLISPETAQSMVRYYRQRFLRRNELTQADIENIKFLKLEIEKRMEFIFRQKNANAVFVRMSNRSPKDGIPLLKAGDSQAAMIKAIYEDTEIDSLNEKMVRICDLQLKNLRCSNSDQVMNLLLTSERVYTDLNLALNCHRADQNDEWSSSVILREWREQLRADFEFRVFVHDRKVVAISQYNPYCIYESLVQLVDANQEKFINDIVGFVKEACLALELNNFIIDVAFVNDCFKVIELNPYVTTTGAGFFHWVGDKAILFEHESEKPIFRRRTELWPDIDHFMQNFIEIEESMEHENKEPYYSLLDSLDKTPKI